MIVGVCGKNPAFRGGQPGNYSKCISENTEFIRLCMPQNSRCNAEMPCKIDVFKMPDILWLLEIAQICDERMFSLDDVQLMRAFIIQYGDLELPCAVHYSPFGGQFLYVRECNVGHYRLYIMIFLCAAIGFANTPAQFCYALHTQNTFLTLTQGEIDEYALF